MKYCGAVKALRIYVRYHRMGFGGMRLGLVVFVLAGGLVLR